MSEKAIKPFARQGHFTVVDNAIFDFVLPNISRTSGYVLLFIIRKTIGWQKDKDAISYSQLREITGIKGKSTISKAIKELERIGIITVQRTHSRNGSTVYSLNKEYAVEESWSPKNGVQKMDTQKESITKEREGFSKDENPSSPNGDSRPAKKKKEKEKPAVNKEGSLVPEPHHSQTSAEKPNQVNTRAKRKSSDLDKIKEELVRRVSGIIDVDLELDRHEGDGKYHKGLNKLWYSPMLRAYKKIQDACGISGKNKYVYNGFVMNSTVRVYEIAVDKQVEQGLDLKSPSSLVSKVETAGGILVKTALPAIQNLRQRNALDGMLRGRTEYTVGKKSSVATEIKGGV